MKNIPIVILNKDRLHPLQLLIESLRSRGYNNIIIIDNESTYPPLMEWYKVSGAEVFYNNIPETLYDTGTFYRLAFEIKHPRFVEIVKDFYVFTDSDVIPDDDIPVDFIDNMVKLCGELKVHKIGLGLRVDNLPETSYTNSVKEIEAQYWSTKIDHMGYKLYAAPIDTTFAVYYPDTKPLWGHGFRMGGQFVAKHMPWYYDIENLPEDELYYLKNLKPNRGPTYSMQVKNTL